MKLRVGVIGLGYWGPNYIRNFMRDDQTEVIFASDIKESALKKIQKAYPHLRVTKDYREVLNAQTVDLIAIATPPETHYKIAKAALDAHKHVLIAKPLATTSADAIKLLKEAKKKKLLLHGDLTYLYTDSIKVIKKLLRKNVIGQPLYYDSIRSNLGLIQNNINVIWDLAPHDFSIISFLFGLKPLKVFATASKRYKNSKGEEIAHIIVNYSNNFLAHIHVSWLSPIKLRTTLIGGVNKMILFDDIEPDEKVRIYNKSISISSDLITPFKPVYRSGDVFIPKLNQEEALYQEVQDIVDQLKDHKINYQNADLNIEIIKLLEACDESLKNNKPIVFKSI